MWTILYCHRYDGFGPNKNSAMISNPSAQVLSVETKNKFPSRYAWYNADRVTRDGIRKIRHKITGTNIAIAEWDTAILQRLEDDLDLSNTFRWAKEKTYNHWAAPKDMAFYKTTYLKDFVIGGIRFAYVEMGVDVLDIWLEPRYDWLYEENLYCEVRPSTILNSRGVIISGRGLQKPMMSGPKDKKILDNPGIYHPIYKAVPYNKVIELVKLNNSNEWNYLFKEQKT